MKNKCNSWFLAAMLFLGIAAILPGCEYKHLEPPQNNNTSNNNLPDTVKFHRDVLPIIHQNCSLPACHSGNQPTGNLNLEDSMAYHQLISRQEVDTLHPTYSSIYIKLTSPTNYMPPTGKLDSRSVALILKWIQQGAKNN